MKTTIELPDELLLRAKQAALERRTSLKEVIESALVHALGRAPGRHPPLRTVVWPPADNPGSSVTSAEILRMIRDERDSATSFMPVVNDISRSSKAGSPIKDSPKTPRVPGRRKK